MRIDIISLFPEIFSTFDYGVIKRARERQLLDLNCWNPRDYAHDKYKTVDDHPYGGGPGMLMKVGPLQEAIQAARQLTDNNGKNSDPLVIHLSPQGRLFDQAKAEKLSEQAHLILISGHYEGIDERIVDLEIDEELSIGDYVLSGGEFAVMVVVDAIARLLPGALGNASSAEQDSLSQDLLEYPQYTRPACYAGLTVPEVLLSGDHPAIERWRLQQSLGRTWLRRPDLLAKRALTEDEQALLTEFIHARGQKHDN
jgi:tRNA (guanine37-N1)-methyltransferase